MKNITKNKINNKMQKIEKEKNPYKIVVKLIVSDV